MHVLFLSFYLYFDFVFSMSFSLYFVSHCLLHLSLFFTFFYFPLSLLFNLHKNKRTSFWDEEQNKSSRTYQNFGRLYSLTPFKTHHPKCNKSNIINKNLNEMAEQKTLGSDKHQQNYKCAGFRRWRLQGRGGHVSNRKTHMKQLSAFFTREPPSPYNSFHCKSSVLFTDSEETLAHT